MPWDTAEEKNRCTREGTMQPTPWGWPRAPEFPLLDSGYAASTRKAEP